nr:hypothetical protein [Tanacetum cinerariifolium]
MKMEILLEPTSNKLMVGQSLRICRKLKDGGEGDLEDKGVASIATSSSSSGTISKHLFNSAVSSSTTLACSCSANFCFLALSFSSFYLALLELPSVTSA